MKPSFFAYLTVLGLLFLWSAPLPAQGNDSVESMQCGEATIQIGDDAATVEQKCGAPTQALKDELKEAWVYNFGPDQRMHFLIFKDDRLENIQMGDMGK